MPYFINFISTCQSLLHKDLCDKNPGLREMVLKFLAPGLWEKHKSELARKASLVIHI